MAPDVPSKSQLDKSGRRLRKQRSAPPLLDADAIAQREADIEDVNAYRRSFGEPLVKVRIGLSSFCRTSDVDGAITQRTKRFDRIVAKLVRFPTSRLSQMQDVGGVRVVVPDLAELAALAEHVTDRWSRAIRRHDDYVADPQDSGYRAHHIVVERDDRLIEVQLRTESQHSWADSVESIGRLVGAELKWGEGPDDVLAYFRVLGDVVELADLGEELPAELLLDVAAHRDAARTSIMNLMEGTP